MNPIDPSIATPIIAQWAGFGAILLLSFAVNFILGRALTNCWVERLAETKEFIAATLKASTDGTQALKDMRTTVDAVIALLAKAKP